MSEATVALSTLPKGNPVTVVIAKELKHIQPQQQQFNKSNSELLKQNNRERRKEPSDKNKAPSDPGANVRVGSIFVSGIRHFDLGQIW